METTALAFQRLLQGSSSEKLCQAPSLRELLRARGFTSTLHSSASLSPVNNRARWTETEGSVDWLHSTGSQEVQCSEITLAVKTWVYQVWTGAQAEICKSLFLTSFYPGEVSLSLSFLLVHAHTHTHVCVCTPPWPLYTPGGCRVQPQSTADQIPTWYS